MNKYGCIFSSIVLAIAFSGYAQNGKLTAVPHKLTVHSGSDFNIIIKVNAGGEPVSATDLYMVFDTTYLKVIDLIPVDSPLNLNPIEPRLDNLNGSVLYSAFKLGTDLPTELFPLISVRFRAKEATHNTSIKFPIIGRYKTLLAYAGENMLDKVRDINILILPEKNYDDGADSKSEPELKVHCSPELRACTVSFKVSKSGLASLELQNSSEETSTVLFSDIAYPEMEYQFGLDTDLIPRGQNSLDLILDDLVISRTIEN